MKKILLFLLLSLLLVSCSLVTQDGFHIFRYADINPDLYIIQSYDNFVIDGKVYNEKITEQCTIYNMLNKEISVKITKNCISEWVFIDPMSTYTITE